MTFSIPTEEPMVNSLPHCSHKCCNTSFLSVLTLGTRADFQNLLGTVIKGHVKKVSQWRHGVKGEDWLDTRIPAIRLMRGVQGTTYRKLQWSGCSPGVKTQWMLHSKPQVASICVHLQKSPSTREYILVTAIALSFVWPCRTIFQIWPDFVDRHHMHLSGLHTERALVKFWDFITCSESQDFSDVWQAAQDNDKN